MSETTLERLMYRRGYIICNGPVDHVEAYLRQAGLHSMWDRFELARCTVFIHVDCHRTLIQPTACTNYVFLIGHAVDPISGFSKEHQIASKLYRALRFSRVEFLEALDDLTGTFVVLVQDNKGPFILADATSVKPIFYDHTADPPTIYSSHSKLISRVRQAPLDKEVQYIYNSPAYKGEPAPFVPGVRSHYQDVWALTGNTLMNIKTGTIEHFWPRCPIEPVSSSELMVPRIAEILHKTCSLILEKSSVSVALTAGYDSRVAAAAFGELPRDSHFYTYTSRVRDKLLVDRDIASEISGKLNSKHETYDLKEVDFSHPIAKAVNSSFHRPIFATATVIAHYATAAGERIKVRSTVSEIGRCRYKHRSEASEPSSELLAKKFTHRPIHYDPTLQSIMSEFMEVSHFRLDQFYGVSFYDMLYWDHFNAKWQNAICSEMETATDVIILYNNRRLLSHMLACPEDERDVSRVHELLIAYMAPVLSDIPINPKG